MNCDHCGAPLNIAEGRDCYYCEYCGSYSYPTPNEDGVALLGEASTYPCPVCKTPLVPALVKSVHICSCPTCRGNLVSQSAMLPILREAQPQNWIGEDPPPLPDQTEFKRSLRCPVCQKLMEAYPYGGPGNMIIQGCAGCRYIWLDYGELARIIRFYFQAYNHPPDERGAKRRGIVF